MFGVSASMALYGVLQAVLNKFSDDDDNEKEDLLKKLNFERWFNTVYLPREFGNITIAGMPLSELMESGLLNTMTGADFASGLSEGSLFFRDLPESADFDNALANGAISFTGPSGGVVSGMYKAGKAWSEGETLKGVEKFIPMSMLRSPFTAYRYSEQGETNYNLDSLKKASEFTEAQLLMQGMGFKPADLSKLQSTDAFIRKEQTKIMTERTDLIRKFVKAEQLHDPELQAKWLEKMRKFNAHFPHPDLQIDSDAIFKYREGKIDEKMKTIRGMEYQEKFYQLFEARRSALQKMNEPPGLPSESSKPEPKSEPKPEPKSEPKSISASENIKMLQSAIEEENAAHLTPVITAIFVQESSAGTSKKDTSVDDARGPMQIIPSTFALYAKKGESINDPADNRRVGVRIIKDIASKYGNDPARIATGYFSGAGNINRGEGNPWKRDSADGNGKRTSAYARDVVNRVEKMKKE